MFDMFDLTSLRTGIMAGALCPIELMRAVTEKMHITHITSVYGLTETSPGMTHTVLTDSFETRCTSVGREYPFTEVKILKPETGAECAVDEPGEVCCRGYLMMDCY
jgi:fatty-acyl-CoA synthase